jgi:acetoin:2,6-dichlorophenolindophenol oxidoreductase subunit alpha
VGGDIAARARVFGIDAERVDGMDVRIVRDTMRRQLERARNGDGPGFVECRTYRFVGHSRSDPATYRKPGELEQWQQRDPLKLAREALAEAGVPASVLEEADGTAREEVTRAFETALAADFPPVDELVR